MAASIFFVVVVTMSPRARAQYCAPRMYSASFNLKRILPAALPHLYPLLDSEASLRHSSQDTGMGMF